MRKKIKFKTFLKAKKLLQKNPELKKRFDENKDGILDPNELEKGAKILGQELESKSEADPKNKKTSEGQENQPDGFKEEHTKTSVSQVSSRTVSGASIWPEFFSSRRFYFFIFGLTGMVVFIVISYLDDPANWPKTYICIENKYKDPSGFVSYNISWGLRSSTSQSISYSHEKSQKTIFGSQDKIYQINLFDPDFDPIGRPNWNNYARSTHVLIEYKPDGKSLTRGIIYFPKPNKKNPQTSCQGTSTFHETHTGELGLR